MLSCTDLKVPRVSIVAPVLTLTFNILLGNSIMLGFYIDNFWKLFDLKNSISIKINKPGGGGSRLKRNNSGKAILEILEKSTYFLYLSIAGKLYTMSIFQNNTWLEETRAIRGGDVTLSKSVQLMDTSALKILSLISVQTIIL